MTLANKTLTPDGLLDGAGGNKYGSPQFMEDLYDAVAGIIPVTPPDVVGARDDGTALAALLTALESIGLITDSTTAT